MSRTFTSKLLLLLVLLLTSIVSSANRTMAGTAFQNETQSPAAYAGAEAFVRTELFFGTARENLPPVTDDDWRGFLNTVITERFPDGLTVLTAYGQFKDSSGKVASEKSFIVILLYPLHQRKASSHSIEQIRRIYTSAFNQQSVLRVDYPLPVHVSF